MSIPNKHRHLTLCDLRQICPDIDNNLMGTILKKFGGTSVMLKLLTNIKIGQMNLPADSLHANLTLKPLHAESLDWSAV